MSNLQTYYLILTKDKKILSRLSFLYEKDKQFYILDEVGEICDKIVEFIINPEKVEASWSRDIGIHELTYYNCKVFKDCNDDYDYDNPDESCLICEECCVFYFFAEDKKSDWYFEDQFGWLLNKEI